jgi:hypothetical protein
MICTSILAFILGFYLLWQAIQSLLYKRTIFMFPFKLDLWLTRKFQSEEAAQEYINRMSEPKRLFWLGIRGLVASIFLLFIGVYYLFT